MWLINSVLQLWLGSHRGLALQKPLQVQGASERTQVAKFKGRPGGRAALCSAKYPEPQVLLCHSLLHFSLLTGSG